MRNHFADSLVIVLGFMTHSAYAEEPAKVKPDADIDRRGANV